MQSQIVVIITGACFERIGKTNVLLTYFNITS